MSSPANLNLSFRVQNEISAFLLLELVSESLYIRNATNIHVYVANDDGFESASLY